MKVVPASQRPFVKLTFPVRAAVDADGNLLCLACNQTSCEYVISIVANGRRVETGVHRTCGEAYAVLGSVDADEKNPDALS